MKKMLVLFGIVVAGLLIASCATERYGRLQEITPTEAKILTCEQIEVEVEKCNYFIKGTNDKDDEFTGNDVLGFLGDFGIGNSMEHTAAIKSATDRLVELTELKREKNCVTTTATPIQ